MSLDKRLARLEQPSAAKQGGVLVFYQQSDGTYCDTSLHVYNHSASELGVPSFVRRYTQVEVDELERTHQVIVVCYVNDWREQTTR